MNVREEDVTASGATRAVKAAIFIAVEKYADKHIGGVKYAEADARELAAVLEQHGFAAASRELLINDGATKTSIESAVRTTLLPLGKDDTLYLYYAGHGFSKIGGDSYLTCSDTRRADPEHTSLRLSWLLEQLQGSQCGRIVLFLDAASGGFLTGDQGRGVYGHLDNVELQSLLESAGHCVCFAACQTGEQSFASSDLRHGVWAHHVIQAFDGQDRMALSGTRLTTSSLQKYLQAAVPLALRKIDPQAVQTPAFYGAARGDFLLADMQGLFANRKSARHPQADQVKDSILLAETIASIKSLPGFKKAAGHFVPDRHSASAQSLIHTIAAPDIKNDVDLVRAALKGAFRFTRLQLRAEIGGDGRATVTTPHFNYNVSVEQDPADPASIVWRRSVDAITDPDQVLSDEFQAVFASVFDTVELTLQHDIDLEQWIDRIELLGSDEVQVSYDEDEDIKSCALRLKGLPAAIRVTARTFSVVHPRPKAPRQLLQSLLDIQLALARQHHVLAIPFPSPDAEADEG